jgi:hypothetical protein
LGFPPSSSSRCGILGRSAEFSSSMGTDWVICRLCTSRMRSEGGLRVRVYYTWFHTVIPTSCRCVAREPVSACGNVCPAVRKRGPRTPTAQSCALVAPECAVQVDVWSPKRSIPCFLQPHRSDARWWALVLSACSSKAFISIPRAESGTVALCF